MTNPFGGTELYNVSLCLAEVIALCTACRVTLDLMLLAAPNSCVISADICDICPPGGMMSETSDVPFPRAAESDFTRDFTFHIALRFFLFVSTTDGVKRKEGKKRKYML